MNEFEKRYLDMCHGIDLCIQQELQLPTLTLIYSAIDSLSWIAYGSKKGVKDNFKKWVIEFMYQEKKLNVTPMDLYSARCSVIHSLTPNSPTTKKKLASRIVYAWGMGECESLEEVNSKMNQDFKVLHIEDLYESFKAGRLKFSKSDILKTSECIERLGEQYVNLSKEDLDKFNSLYPDFLK